MIHSKKSKSTQYRLFNYFYTSSSDSEVLHGKQYLDDVFEEQSFPKLHSGQECRFQFPKELPYAQCLLPRSVDCFNQH